MAAAAAAWQPRGVKLFVLLLALGLAAAAALVPVAGKTMWARAEEAGLPKAAAKATAHGLRATWDFMFAEKREPHAPPRHASRKAQAHRVSREGIVAQPPKERIDPRDRSSLDALLSRR